jgi:hypothetical protein
MHTFFIEIMSIILIFSLIKFCYFSFSILKKRIITHFFTFHCPNKDTIYSKLRTDGEVTSLYFPIIMYSFG